MNEKYLEELIIYIQNLDKAILVKKDENLYTDESDIFPIEHKFIKIVIEKEQYSNKNSELEKKRE